MVLCICLHDALLMHVLVKLPARPASFYVIIVHHKYSFWANSGASSDAHCSWYTEIAVARIMTMAQMISSSMMVAPIG